VYYPDLLSAAEQQEVLAKVDSGDWQDEIKRRVQHYGYKYNYDTHRIDPSMYVGPLPPFAVVLSQRMLALRLISELPDQLIVNEYKVGQGIAAHIDCEECFDDTIATISLGSVYAMDLIHATTRESHEINLDLGSCLVFSGPARMFWKHGIRRRKTDHGRPRGRRVSLTFRNVILAQPAAGQTRRNARKPANLTAAQGNSVSSRNLSPPSSASVVGTDRINGSLSLTFNSRLGSRPHPNDANAA
jgi:alkylated DNA repair dioxygenase AlkB